MSIEETEELLFESIMEESRCKYKKPLHDIIKEFDVKYDILTDKQKQCYNCTGFDYECDDYKIKGYQR